MKKIINKLYLLSHRYYLKNLSLYLTICYIIGFIISYLNPFLFEYLSFYSQKILNGELWRLITCLIIPTGGNIIYVLISIIIFYSLSIEVEAYMGSRNYNIFFFSSFLLSEIILIIISLIMKTHIYFNPHYILTSVFLAYAILFPDNIFLIMFIIPIKAKYIGILEALAYIYLFTIGDYIIKIHLICAFLPVIILYIKKHNQYANPIQYINIKHRQKEYHNNMKEDKIKDNNFNLWLNDALVSKIPDEVKGYCFNIYKDNDRYAINLIGTSLFDLKDENWATEEITDFNTFDNPYYFDSDKDILISLEKMIKEYLNNGKYKEKLLKSDGIAMGIIDGELKVIYNK